VADVRESPSLDVLAQLVERGAEVEFHDPYVAEVVVKLSERALAQVDGSPDHKEAVLRLARVDLSPSVEEADCVVICTDHSAGNAGRSGAFDSRYAQRAARRRRATRRGGEALAQAAARPRVWPRRSEPRPRTVTQGLLRGSFPN
jgi:hypothetical protein